MERLERGPQHRIAGWSAAHLPRQVREQPRLQDGLLQGCVCQVCLRMQRGHIANDHVKVGKIAGDSWVHRGCSEYKGVRDVSSLGDMFPYVCLALCSAPKSLHLPSSIRTTNPAPPTCRATMVTVYHAHVPRESAETKYSAKTAGGTWTRRTHTPMPKVGRLPAPTACDAMDEDGY